MVMCSRTAQKITCSGSSATVDRSAAFLRCKSAFNPLAARTSAARFRRCSFTSTPVTHAPCSASAIVEAPGPTPTSRIRCPASGRDLSSHGITSVLKRPSRLEKRSSQLDVAGTQFDESSSGTRRSCRRLASSRAFASIVPKVDRLQAPSSDWSYIARDRRAAVVSVGGPWTRDLVPPSTLHACRYPSRLRASTSGIRIGFSNPWCGGLRGLRWCVMWGGVRARRMRRPWLCSSTRGRWQWRLPMGPPRTGSATCS